MASVTRKHICDAVAYATSLAEADVTVVLEGMLQALRAALMEGESVKLTGFGTLQVRPRAERLGRNPRSGEEHLVTARKTVVFVPGRNLQQQLREISK